MFYTGSEFREVVRTDLTESECKQISKLIVKEIERQKLQLIQISCVQISDGMLI